MTGHLDSPERPHARRGPTLSTLAAACVWVFAGLIAAGEDDAAGPPRALAERSLALRTALHRDPTLDEPLKRLVKMYREENRTQELLEMYRAHLARFPDDANAQAVLIRLLAAFAQPEALAKARGAAERYPKNAYLQFLLYQLLSLRHEPGALAALDRAIALQPRPARKRAWIEKLLPEARDRGQPGLAKKHLQSLAASATTAQAALDVARRMMEYGHPAMALETLQARAERSPAPETAVEIALATARAEAALGKRAAAVERLEALLERVTADYWRRRDILRQRLALAESEQERQRLLDAARTRVEEHPQDEAAVLDLAELLSGFEFRRQALHVLQEGARRIPASNQIEQAVFELFDLLRDEHGRATFLAERLAATPERDDLALRYVKTLFLLGRRKEARERLASLCADLPEETRLPRRLDMARFLRRSNLSRDAMQLFSQLHEELPARLDVRRELAELCLATGHRQRARELFDGGLPEDAPLEAVLDAVQFMIEQRLFLEARTALRQRMAVAKTNLQLRMQLVNVEKRLGDPVAGQRVLEAARSLADTVARYRQWLEGAADFYEAFDSLEKFLGEEERRLAGEQGERWSERAVARRLAFAEVAARSGFQNTALALLEADLTANPPQAIRVKLRRRIVAALANGALVSDALEAHLKALAEEDPHARHEVNARLACLYARQNQHHEIRPLIEDLSIEAIHDPALLAALQSVLAGFRRTDAWMRALERLTRLDPTNRNTWEKWIAALAQRGDETTLRVALRRLLAGVERMPLAADTHKLLRGHLVDSYWRSIVDTFQGGTPSDLHEVLVLLGQVGRQARTHPHSLWILWTRAHVLHRLGRTAARDEALDELERVARERPLQPPGEAAAGPGAPGGGSASAGRGGPPASLDPDKASPGLPRICFPDGLSLDIDAARFVLTRPRADPPDLTQEERCGPRPPLAVRWSFAATGGVPITRVVPVGTTRMLVLDAGGRLYALDAAGGKVVWHVSGVGEGRTLSTSGNAQPRGAGYPAKLVVEGNDRVYVAGAKVLTARSLEDGRVLWRTRLAAAFDPFAHGAGAQMHGGWTSCALAEDRLYAFDAVSSTLFEIDPSTGKIVQETGLPGPTVQVSTGGLHLSGPDLFAYGTRTAILDRTSGRATWSFAPHEARTFPFRLRAPEKAGRPGRTAEGASAAAAAAAASAASARFAHTRRGMWAGRMPSGGGFRQARPRTQHQVQYFDFLQRQASGWSPSRGGMQPVALTSPSVLWARAPHARLGLLCKERLLLMQEGALQVLRLDLPVAARRVNVSGTFIGLAGNRCCFLQGAQLQMVDLASGQSSTCAVDAVHEGAQAPWIQACVDGILVYASGPEGIACVNTRTGATVFSAPWPASVRPPRAPTPTVAEERASHPAFASGVSVGVPAGFRARHAATPWGHAHPGVTVQSPRSVHYKLLGCMVQQSGHAGPFIPPVAQVANGCLYTTVSPDRLVALTEEGPP